MALSERAEKIAQKILKGKIVEDLAIDRNGNLLATELDWDKKVKAVGMKVPLAERLVFTIQRALEDEEEIRIYFVNERQTGESDDWIVMVAVQDPDGAIFIAITPGILAETKSTNGLIAYIKNMIASVRPNGRPFGVQPSLN